MGVLSFSFHWISSQIPHQNQPVEDLIRTIDWALYATKAQGEAIAQRQALPDRILSN